MINLIQNETVKIDLYLVKYEISYSNFKDTSLILKEFKDNLQLGLILYSDHINMYCWLNP